MKNKILKYILLDLIRNKFIIGYAILLLIISLAIIYIGRDSTKAVITIMNLILFIVPLVSLIFGTIHFYNSGEFMEFLLTQPVDRKSIFVAEYFGLACSLSLGFLTGVGIPVLIYGISFTGIFLLLTGIVLTFIFVSVAFFSSLINKDRVKGIGLSIIIWLYLAIIFDGVIITIIFLFRDYPIDKLIIILTSLNPVDLGRILMLLQVDVSALMGFTGATFKNFFGSFAGILFSGLILLLWIVLPVILSLRIFKKKNF